MNQLSEIQKQQRAVMSAINSRRSGSCNRSQLGRDLPLYNRGLIGRVLEELLAKKWIVDVSTNSAFRYRLTSDGGAELSRLNRQFWVEIGEWEKAVAQDKRDARAAKVERAEVETVTAAAAVLPEPMTAGTFENWGDAVAPEPTRVGYAQEGRWAFEQATSAAQRASNFFALAELPTAASIAGKAVTQLDLFAQQLDLWTSEDYLARLAK